MDSTSPPPYQKSEPRNRTKSASRLSKLRYYNEENEEVVTPNLSLEIVPSSPTVVPASPSPTKFPCGIPLHELILLSPSPLRKSKTRLADRLEMGDDVAETDRVRRRSSKHRSSGSGLLAHSSPRNHRRSRRRFEQDLREDKDYCPGDDMVMKPRKKRQSGRPKKDKLSLVTSVPSPSML